MNILFYHREDLKTHPHCTKRATFGDPVSEREVSVGNIEIDEIGNVTVYEEPCGWYVVLTRDEVGQIATLWRSHITSLHHLDAQHEEGVETEYSTKYYLEDIDGEVSAQLWGALKPRIESFIKEHWGEVTSENVEAVGKSLDSIIDDAITALMNRKV